MTIRDLIVFHIHVDFWGVVHKFFMLVVTMYTVIEVITHVLILQGVYTGTRVLQTGLACAPTRRQKADDLYSLVWPVKTGQWQCGHNKSPG